MLFLVFLIDNLLYTAFSIKIINYTETSIQIPLELCVDNKSLLKCNTIRLISITETHSILSHIITKYEFISILSKKCNLKSE